MTKRLSSSENPGEIRHGMRQVQHSLSGERALKVWGQGHRKDE